MRVHRWILLCAVILTVGIALAQTTGKTVRKSRVAEESAADAEIEKAESAVENKDYASAEVYLRQAIARRSNDERAWFDLGFVLNAKGQRAESIEAYRKSVAANPAVFESNLTLGLMLARDGDPEAEKYLRAATLLKPTSHANRESARAYLALGHVLEKSNPKGALEAFKAASALQPQDIDAHLSSARMLERLKEYADAAGEYKRVSELNPKSSEALAGLVNVYQQTGRLSEAEPLLRQYIALNSQDATAHTLLARILTRQGKTEEGISEYRTAVNLSPDDYAARRQFAEILLEAKQYAEAEALLTPLIQKWPNDAMLHRAMGSALMHQHKYPEAQNELLAALKLKSDIPEACGDLAVVANENKNYGLALKALDERAKFAQETPATYFLRATLYDHLRMKQEAISAYHRFLETANGKFPDDEWKARHRLIALEPKN